jgi:RNA polymerase sigma factor (TIGR02999 family)
MLVRMGLKQDVMSQSWHLCKANHSVNTSFIFMRTVGVSRRLDAKSLLLEVRHGDGKAGDRLMSVLYADLRRIVSGVMASEGPIHPVQPAAVVNEALLGWVQSRGRSSPSTPAAQLDWQSRAHLLAIASHQMRLVLADYQRRRSTTKVETPLKIAWRSTTNGAGETLYQFAVIDQLLRQWGQTDARLARIFEMYCFAGMSAREIGLVEHTSTAKAKRDCDLARDYITEAASAGLMSVSSIEYENAK